MRWKYINICTHDDIKMSGWKLYIYGENEIDSFIISLRTIDIVKRYNLTMKVATNSIINFYKNTNLPWSVAVIYLSSDVFAENRISYLIKDLSLALSYYDKKGIINGARSIDDKIHYRYELTIPINLYEGIEYVDYLINYRESGDYNVPNNVDIYSLLNQ